MAGTPDDGGPARAAIPRDRRIDLAIAACVVLISLVSLFVAVSANRTQERLLTASVWPSVVFGTSSASNEGVPQVSIDLLNRGIGPARMRWAEVTWRDAPVRNARELLAACCGQPAEAELDRVFTSGIQRRVIGADEWITLLRMPRPEPVTPVWTALEASRLEIALRACYCSVLDDCWLLDSRTDHDPTPVRTCPAPPAVQWGG